MGFTNPYPASRLTVDSTNSLVTGMQLWFPFTTGTGTTAQCILHAYHTGTLQSGASWASSDIGTVLELDGSSEVDFTSDISRNKTAVSCSAWIKPDSVSGNNFVFYEENGTVTHRTRFGLIVADGRLRCGGRDDDGDSFTNFAESNTSTVVTGVWQHVVAVFDPTGGGCKVYLDGVDVTVSSDNTGDGFPDTASLNQVIGGIGGHGSFYFDGQIQNLRVYDRALSATEVTTLYHRPWEGSNYGDLWPYSPPAAGSMTLSTDTAATSIMADIEGWWVMTDGSGTTLTDISGNGRDATLNGTNTWENETLGTANRFDNSVSRTSHAETANTQPDLTGGYTFSTWIKHEELAQGGSNKYGAGIVLGNSSGSADFEVYFRGNHTAQHPQVVHNRSNGGTHVSYYINNLNYTDDNNVWVNFAVTYDGSSIKIYRDGVYQGASSSGVAAPLSTSGYKIYLNELPVVANQGGLTCSMQNTRLWSRALSATEVATLYERPWEGIEYGDTFHYDPPAPASMLPLTSDAINTDQELWLPLTDGTGTTATDISGNSYAGTARSSQGWATTLLGTAADNDSLTNGGFTCGDQSGLDMYGDKSFSLWVKPNGGSATQVLFEKRSSSGGLEGYSCYVRYNTDSTVGFLADSGSSTTTASSASALVTDVWSNVCVVVSGNNATIYVNGVAGTTVTNADFAADLSNTVDFVTGYAQRDPSTQDDFDGSMQNVRVWSRALTADEVWSIYSNPWLGSNYKLASGSTPLYNYIFRTERFRRLG